MLTLTTQACTGGPCQMMNEKSGKPRPLLPCANIERSTLTGDSDQETLRRKSRMEPRNGRPRGVAAKSSPKRNIGRNGAQRSRVSWRKALPVRCWRMRSENTIARQVQSSRTRRNYLPPGEREIPTARNDNRSKKRPSLCALAQVLHAHAVRRCRRKAAFRYR